MEPRFYPFNLTEEKEQLALEIYREAFVLDAGLLGANIEYPQCIREYQHGGVNGGISTVAAGLDNFARAMESVLKYRKIIASEPDKFLLATSIADLEKAKATGRLGIVLAFQDTKPVEDDLEHLDAFLALGVRVIQLTYNIQNYAGSGCTEIHCAGLTHFGRELVKEMNRLGVAIDLSHCSDPTTTDAIEWSEKPVLLTHSNVYNICPGRHRNASDDQIRALAGKGGVIGIVFRPNFVKRDSNHNTLPCKIDDVLDHIEYVINLVGVDFVGFGSDICTEYMIPGTPDMPWLADNLGASTAEIRRQRRDVFGYNEVWMEVKGLESALHFVNLARGLVARGFGKEEVKKVLGGNFLRALSVIWGSGSDASKNRQ